MKISYLSAVLAMFLIARPLQAQAPALINYQGRIVVGTTNFDGPGYFKFALVDETGAESFWSNDRSSAHGSEPSTPVSLSVVKGLYSVLLGDNSLGAAMRTLGAADLAHPDVRLRVWFSTAEAGPFELLTPDQRLAPAAYLADGSVTAATIEDQAITAAKIADEAIDAAKIGFGAVTAEKITTGAINISHLVAGVPQPGKVLSYDGTDIAWTDPGGADGIWTLLDGNVSRALGNVGIGISNPATKLEVRTGPGSYGLMHSDGTIKIASYVGGSASGATGGWLGTQSNHPLHFYVNGGQPQMTIANGGVGIGTATVDPAYRLTVAGSTAMSVATGKSVTFGTPNSEVGMSLVGPVPPFNFNRADVRFDGTTLKLLAGTGTGAMSSNNGIAVTTAGNVGIGTTSPQSKLEVNGTIRAKVLTILGADVAEPFEIAEADLSKGTVVVIDSTRHGGLKRSTVPYDTRVAGIVSGANGVDSGIILSQPGVNEGGQNVAISGRVYVHADATSGRIEPGDLLTTSDLPGHAMKVNEHTRAQGAILGKAMSALEEGTGMVLVLVTLQ